jgi:hypothetical protein
MRSWSGKFVRAGVLGATLALGGCGSSGFLIGSSFLESMPAWPTLPSLADLPGWDVLSPFDPSDCAQVSKKALRQVNWTRVPQINMRIRHDEYEPMVIQMKQGWPYIFRIRNRDDKDHYFAAREFFRNMAVIHITVDGKRQDDTCISKLKVPARQTAELRLVAAIDGRYEFEDRRLRAFPWSFRAAPAASSWSRNGIRRSILKSHTERPAKCWSPLYHAV